MKRLLALTSILSVLAFFVPFTANAAACSSTKSATTYYSFDLNNSNDSSGNGNNGTDSSMSYGSAYGKINDGATFPNGNTGSAPTHYITVPSGTYSIANATNSYSVNVWINPASGWSGGTQSYSIFSFTSNTGSYKYDTRFYWQNSFSYLRGDGTTINELDYSTTPTAGTWYMMTLTYDGATMTMYSNGSSVGTLASTLNAGSMVSSSYIGRESSGSTSNGFNGYMDEMGFYPCTLTTTQITSLYNGGAGINPFTMATITSVFAAIYSIF